MMLQRVIQSSGLDIFAQIGLIAFIIAFVLVLIWVFLIDSDEAERRAGMALSEEERERAAAEMNEAGGAEKDAGDADDATETQ